MPAYKRMHQSKLQKSAQPVSPGIQFRMTSSELNKPVAKNRLFSHLQCHRDPLLGWRPSGFVSFYKKALLKFNVDIAYKNGTS